MQTDLPAAETRARVPIALVGAIVLTLLVFLAIPITQHLDNKRSQILDFREAITITPPAPVVTPPAPEEVPQSEPEPKPEFEEQFQDFSLSQLELSLNPSIGDAISIGVSNGGFSTEVNAVGDIQKLFTFADLQSAPRIINRPRISYPRDLIRKGVREGRVVVKILIDPKGRAKVLEVISATDPGLIPAAKDVIRQARFTPPTVNGEPKPVRGEWPIVLRAP